jgi:hypothetical protein
MSSRHFPSPTLPVKGRVWAGVLGSFVPDTRIGTSPFMGEGGRGKYTARGEWRA